MPADESTADLTIWIVAPAVWIAAVVLYRLTILRILRRGPDGDALVGFLWYVTRAFCRVVHRGRVENGAIVPDTNHPGPLIVVSNHTGSVDPLLIQAACRFKIRWMMASEMMGPGLDWLWRIADVIPVARSGKDTTPTRIAIRHVKAGGVLGIFPEGRIVTPPREIRPFSAGVGLVVARTRAPVLLCWVRGTPDTNDLTSGLVTRSRAVVRFIDRIDFPRDMHAAEITRIIRERIAEASGWPINDEPIPPIGNNNVDPFLV